MSNPLSGAKAGAKYLITEKEYVEKESGQIVRQTEIYKKYDTQKQFWKVWLHDLLQALDLISNSKQMNVLFYILENTRESDNLYIGTYESTAKGAGVSYQTVSFMMQKLLKTDFMIKQHNGVYQVNPSLLMKGSDKKQHKLLIQYDPK